MLETEEETMPVEELLQGVLEFMYRVEGVPRVTPFRVGEDFYSNLGVNLEGGPREALLIHEDGDFIDIALFLSEQALNDARTCLKALARGDTAPLDGLCAVLEGVSHFVYFTFSGEVRPVSRLELELQAEIDKYFVLRSVLGLTDNTLISNLFDHFRLRENLETNSRERYLVANRAARRYARWAHRAFTRGQGANALADARRLYRMPATLKLERIAQAA